MNQATHIQRLIIQTTRILIFLGSFSLAFLFVNSASAKEVQIIEMRKGLTLKNNEKLPTDYFLNAGSELGIKPGTVFTLYRRLSVLDRFGGTQARPLSVPVGKIKIIYTAKNISVARLHELEGAQNLPALEYRGIMLGDLIHVGSAELDSSDKGKDSKESVDVSLQSLPMDILLWTPNPSEDPVSLNAVYMESSVENTQPAKRIPATSPLR